MKKTGIKRFAAGAVAAVMTMGLTGCGENTTWGADIDGQRIPAGVLIYFLQTSYYDAQSKMYEQSSESSDDTAVLDVYTAEIEGKNGKDWIYDDATKQMQIYAAVESKFDEYGLALTDEEKEAVQLYCDQLWDNAEQFYNKMGISQKSYQSIYLNNTKRSKLFEHLYSEGGEYGVPDSDIKSYLDENYALINYIDMELRDGEGNLLKSDGKAERMAMAQEYVERFKNGEDFDGLNAEYVTYYQDLQEEAAANAAANDNGVSGINGIEADGEDLFGGLAEVDISDAQAANAGDGDEIAADGEDETAEDDAVSAAADIGGDDGNANGDNAEVTGTSETDNADGIGNAESEAGETDGNADGTEGEDASDNAEGGEEFDLSDFDLDDLISVNTVDSNRTVIEKDGSVPNATVSEKVFGEMKNGDIEIIETPDGEHYFIVLKYDILEDESYFEAARTSLLFEMKEEDYDSVIDSWTALQNVAKNEESYKRYDPKNLIDNQ
ncbi:MAG: hypothetical protein K2N72_07505 [Oscillospiraceae bacterium]|nr:hypothetical protein [Oscillospiraceae bacterium]